MELSVVLDYQFSHSNDIKGAFGINNTLGDTHVGCASRPVARILTSLLNAWGGWGGGGARKPP